MRKGAAGTILLYVAERFDREVEPLRSGWNWGYAERPIRGSTQTSNHASGTAIDLNAPKHPLGKVGTFSAKQVAAIRRILAACEGTVRWGGDYAGRKDEMHFEIVASASRCAAVAQRLTARRNSNTGGGGAATPAPAPAPKPDPARAYYQTHPEEITVELKPGKHQRYMRVPKGAKRLYITPPEGEMSARVQWHGPKYPKTTDKIAGPEPDYDWIAKDDVLMKIHGMRPWGVAIPEKAVGFRVQWTYRSPDNGRDSNVGSLDFEF